MQLTETQKSEGWRIVKFGEIAKSVSKRVDPSATELEVYVGLEHLDPDNLRITRRGLPSDVKGQKLLVKPGQIIFGKRRAYQRKVAVADFEGICSAHAMVLEAIPEAVVPEYLPFFMQSDMFMERAVAISEGSLSPTIKWKTLANQEFPLPPRPRQEEMLEVFEKIEQIDRISHSAYDLSDLIYCALRIKLTKGEKRLAGYHADIELSALSDHLKKIVGGGTPSRKNRKYWENGTIPWVTVKDLISEKLKGAQEHITPEALANSASNLIPANTVLMATRMAVGKVAVAECDVAINQDMKAFFPKESLSSEYLMNFLASKEKYFNDIGTGSTVKGIQLTDIRSLKSWVPSLDEQHGINKILKTLEDHKFLLNQGIERNKRLRKTLMNKYLCEEVA